MKQTFLLVRQEIRNLLINPAIYIAAVIALSVLGFFYLLMLGTVSSSPQEMAPPTLFFSTFWVPALLIVPMLTMRSIAEERRLGTLESLMTTPVTAGQVVFSKFIAAYLFYLVIWSTTLLFPFLTQWILSSPQIGEQLMETGPLIGGYAFVAISGTLFTAVGIFSSSLTRSQLVAGMLTFSILFILIVGAAAIRFLDLQNSTLPFLTSDLLQYLEVFQHFEDFSRGLFDTRPLVYYFSGTFLVLGLAILNVEAKAR